MSDLIPSVNLTEFTKLKSAISQLKSCEVTFDGVYLFTAIIPPPDGGAVNEYIKTQAEYLAMRGNTVGGVNIEQIKGHIHAAV